MTFNDSTKIVILFVLYKYFTIFFLLFYVKF
nr:MAG TPA: hypothetical protein [Caudoviricetes sp.]DAR74242.1 MAG TPA: hypothetical protein [Caudoviricetes sp.]DAS74601.1 MAG TPA: hypothetical protein [Caudoviricetes sp.]DAW83715.1 MAG TPA: hypothetical protein [Caudoviricetes sp.]